MFRKVSDTVRLFDILEKYPLLQPLRYATGTLVKTVV